MAEKDSKLKSEEMDLFFKAILELENIDECYDFFEDVATINDINALEKLKKTSK